MKGRNTDKISVVRKTEKREKQIPSLQLKALLKLTAEQDGMMTSGVRELPYLYRSVSKHKKTKSSRI